MKRLLVLAGNSNQFKSFCHNLNENYKPIFLSSVNMVYGIANEEYITYGTWYKRHDSQNILEYLELHNCKKKYINNG